MTSSLVEHELIKTTLPKAQISSQPRFLDDTHYLVSKLQKFSVRQIQKLMNVNPEIAALNFSRFQGFEEEFNPANSKQAIMAFTGEVYRGLNCSSFDDPDFEFAQQHVRILSGLYGLLRPLDLIQPYRLEMGTRLKVTEKKQNLYAFWGDRLQKSLIDELNDGEKIINLASNEYVKAAHPKILDNRIININFLDNKNGEYKALMTYAKNARGAMTRFIVKNKITNHEELIGFDLNGYTYNSRLSNSNELTFTRDQIPTS
ncbi:MAG: peroxide stress protein YaaA [Flavobacteriales bacterium]